MEFLKAFLIIYGVISIIFTTIFLVGLIRNIRREIDIIKGVKQAAETLKIVYVEYDVVDSMYRMYDKTNNQFLFQAKDELELWNIARAKYPEKNIITLDADKEAKRV
jgi:hypothetical protein